jgi:hypothetical protein
MTQTQEFLNGWTAAERDKVESNVKRHNFPSYRTADFVDGYRSFWDNIEMTLSDEIRNDMAVKGYVYRRDLRNYPPQNGMRQLCRDLRGEDISKLIFDTDAYMAHGNKI